MYIVFFIIILFILGIIFSKIILTIEKIELTEKNIKFKIKIKLLWFYFLPIFMALFNENGIKILWKNLKYKNIFKKNNISQIIKKDFKNNNFKKLKIQIDLANFTLKIGTENTFITTFLVTIFSTILAEILRKTIKTKIDYKKIHYIVLPEFNKNEIYFDGKTDISFKLLNLTNLIFK